MELMLKIQKLGRIAIPKHIREVLDIKPGDVVTIELKSIIERGEVK